MSFTNNLPLHHNNQSNQHVNSYFKTSQNIHQVGTPTTEDKQSDLNFHQQSSTNIQPGAVSASHQEGNSFQYDDNPVKFHGFQWPLHPLQVMSWVVYAYNLVHFYVVTIPILTYELIETVILAVIYFILGMFVFYFTYVTTKKDPSDRTVYKERLYTQHGANIGEMIFIKTQGVTAKDMIKFNPDDYSYFCNICDTHVLEFTKHCQACNRCVSNFDHHCKWLNNCIGDVNYREFFKMLILVFISLVYQGGINIGILVEYKHLQELNPQEYSSSYITDNLSSKRFHQATIVNLIINTLVCMMVGKLLFYHIWLRTQKLTTYQHLVKVQERKDSKKKESKVIKKIEKDLQMVSGVEMEISQKDSDSHNKSKEYESTSSFKVISSSKDNQNNILSPHINDEEHGAELTYRHLQYNSNNPLQKHQITQEIPQHKLIIQSDVQYRQFLCFKWQSKENKTNNTKIKPLALNSSQNIDFQGRQQQDQNQQQKQDALDIYDKLNFAEQDHSKLQETPRQLINKTQNNNNSLRNSTNNNVKNLLEASTKSRDLLANNIYNSSLKQGDGFDQINSNDYYNNSMNDYNQGRTSQLKQQQNQEAQPRKNSSKLRIQKKRRSNNTGGVKDDSIYRTYQDPGEYTNDELHEVANSHSKNYTIENTQSKQQQFQTLGPNEHGKYILTDDRNDLKNKIRFYQKNSQQQRDIQNKSDLESSYVSRNYEENKKQKSITVRKNID